MELLFYEPTRLRMVLRITGRDRALHRSMLPGLRVDYAKGAGHALAATLEPQPTQDTIREPAMRIVYVQFVFDVPQVGTYWSEDKHGKEWSCEEKGSWIVMTNVTDSKHKGHMRRVPITSVACINHVPVDVKKKGE